MDGESTPEEPKFGHTASGSVPQLDNGSPSALTKISGRFASETKTSLEAVVGRETDINLRGV